jgi:hypothetical protein
MPSECIVCGETVPDEAAKFDPQAPVYSDDGVYHLGCESELFDEVHCSTAEYDAIEEDADE